MSACPDNCASSARQAIQTMRTRAIVKLFRFFGKRGFTPQVSELIIEEIKSCDDLYLPDVDILGSLLDALLMSEEVGPQLTVMLYRLVVTKLMRRDTLSTAAELSRETPPALTAQPPVQPQIQPPVQPVDQSPAQASAQASAQAPNQPQPQPQDTLSSLLLQQQELAARIQSLKR